MPLAHGLFDKNSGNPTQHDKGTHHDPKHSAALLTFTLIKCISAVPGIAVGTVMSLGVDEITEAREDFLGVKTDEANVRSHKTPNEGLGGELRILIAFERMQCLDADFSGGRDLLDRDAALLALLAKEIAQRHLRGVESAQGRNLRCFIACSATLVLGKRLLTSTKVLRASSYCLLRS